MKWYQDEELWRLFYDAMFDKDSFTLAEQQVGQIMAMIPARVHSVLDLACGPGRHVIPLARMGLDVTGVDSSAFLLDRAASLIDEENLSATLVHSDILDYNPSKKFDLITNLFTSFGYYEEVEDNLAVLKCAHDWLKPSGYLLIDIFGKENVLSNMQPVHLTEYDNGDIRIERPLLEQEMQVYSNEWILIRDNQAYRKTYQHYVYTASELRGLLNQAGFSSVSIYGGFDAEVYDMESERLVALASK